MTDKDIQTAVDNSIKETTENVQVRTSIGAEIYNIFCKTGLKATPQKFKEFELATFKFIYRLLGAEVDDVLCNFDAFVKSYIQAMITLSEVEGATDPAPEEEKETDNA